jgi:hypothetical protein
MKQNTTRHATRIPFPGRMTVGDFWAPPPSTPFAVGVESLTWTDMGDLLGIIQCVGAQPGMTVADLYRAVRNYAKSTTEAEHAHRFERRLEQWVALDHREMYRAHTKARLGIVTGKAVS